MLAANEIKVNTNELVQILTLSRKEILDLNEPFRCGNDPLFTYPFFGEDELINLTVPPGTSENVLESLEIVLCVETEIEEGSADVVTNTTAINTNTTTAAAVCFLGCNNETILRDAREIIQVKLQEMTKSAGFTVKFHHNWQEYQSEIKSKLPVVEADKTDDQVLKLKKPIGSFYNRLQILLPFFIEAAIPINISDPKWLIYLSVTGEGVIRGLLTAYSYFKFPEGQRVRISQVLIFPRYQGNRLGTQLYRQVSKDLRENPENDCVEICVEDPTDAFERLRSLVDLEDAKSFGYFTEGSDAADVVCEKLIKEMKLSPDQSERIYNLNKCLQLSCPPANPKRPKTSSPSPNDLLRQKIKRWLLKKYRKDLPEKGQERLQKLAELYETELEVFIEPLIDLLRGE